jgi:hypothetical protein
MTSISNGVNPSVSEKAVAAWSPEWDHGVYCDVARYPEQRLQFGLDSSVPLGDYPAVAKRACRQQQVLDGWIHRRSLSGHGSTVALQTRQDNDGSIGHVVDKVLHRRRHARSASPRLRQIRPRSRPLLSWPPNPPETLTQSMPGRRPQHRLQICVRNRLGPIPPYRPRRRH